MNRDRNLKMLIAGKIPLQSVMNRLAGERQVFHSKGDLQHAFGRAIWGLDSRVKVRMEMRHGVEDPGDVLDMLCFTHAGSTAIEFKFHPASGRGQDLRGEEFNLREQSVDEDLRHGFVRDIFRLEKFCNTALPGNGLALLVSNAPALWKEPEGAGPSGYATDFRLHAGANPSKTLTWAGMQDGPRSCAPAGTYDLNWADYAPSTEAFGQFRYLAVEVAGGGGRQPWS